MSASAVRPPSGSRRFGVAAVRDYGIVFSFIILFVGLSIASPVFLTPRNLLNIMDQQSAVGMIAVAGTLVIIAGGFDLSTAAIFALAGIVAASTVSEVGVPIAMLLAIIVSVGIGVANGLLTTVGKINAIIATLAMGIMVRGIAIALTGGQLVRVEDPAFTTLGRGALLGIKHSVWLFVGVIVIATILLSWTRFGRYIYAAGGNAEAARLAGVPVKLVRGTTYALSGLAAGLAGVMISSKVATGQPNTGLGLEIAAIAAIVIGGTSILGGEGAVWRTVLGLLLLAFIRNGFNLLNIDPIFQQIFQGAIILGAVGIDAWARQEQS